MTGLDATIARALAGYNAGEGTVSRAIERNQKLGLPTDYWNLPLPKETQEYVPKLLAVAQIVTSPQAYGVDLNPIANEPYFEVVAFKPRMDLSSIAEMAEVDEDELFQLNPAFKKGVTMDGPQHLLVPSEKAERLAANLLLMKPQKQVQWQQYTVRKGDNLASIAKRHNLTATRATRRAAQSPAPRANAIRSRVATICGRLPSNSRWR